MDSNFPDTHASHDVMNDFFISVVKTNIKNYEVQYVFDKAFIYLVCLIYFV